MSDIAVAGHVVYRNEMGRFQRAIEDGVTRSVSEAIERGAEMSRRDAPIGHKHDTRTLPLAESIHTEMLSSTQGRWFSVARHALATEYGARPHPIEGNPYLKFFWEEKGRWWVSGMMGSPDVVSHPGNRAQPFLRPAYREVMRTIMDTVRKNLDR